MNKSAHERTPMDTPFLIEPAALLERAGASEPRLLIDARLPEQYHGGHIPGAIHLSTYDYFVRSTSEIGINRFQRELSRVYEAAGVTPARPVVVYEEETGMRAAREAWMLQYLGHPDVRLLHGGLRAWRDAGGPLDTAASEAAPASFPVMPRAELIIGANGILARSGLSSPVILDVRSREEYTGTGGSPCCRRRGRIPGAVWIEWTAFLDEKTGRFRPAADIQQILSAHGVQPDQEIITYCHRGARSAAAFYALQHAGCRRVRNFIGSWHEWAGRNDLPVETGV